MSKYVVSILTLIIGILLGVDVIIFSYAKDYNINFGYVTDWIVAIFSIFAGIGAWKAANYTKRVYLNNTINDLLQKIYEEHNGICALRDEVIQYCILFKGSSFYKSLSKGNQDAVCLLREEKAYINNYYNKLNIEIIISLLSRLDFFIKNSACKRCISELKTTVNSIKYSVEIAYTELNKVDYDAVTEQCIHYSNTELAISYIKDLSEAEKNYDELFKQLVQYLDQEISSI